MPFDKDMMNSLVRQAAGSQWQTGEKGFHQQIDSLQPFDMFSKLGRLDVEDFGRLGRAHQEKYLEGMNQAESNGFSKVFGDWLQQYNPGMKGGGLTEEYIRNALTPYYDRMRTGKPNESF